MFQELQIKLNLQSRMMTFWPGTRKKFIVYQKNFLCNDEYYAKNITP